ncbi:hypothetical protein, partial [Methylobacterium soli]|uniref:hypothetical protein n=1 Tax=Methylobacterium soli TaxID=553447 RepID=UPI001AEF89FA
AAEGADRGARRTDDHDLFAACHLTFSSRGRRCLGSRALYAVQGMKALSLVKSSTVSKRA